MVKFVHLEKNSKGQILPFVLLIQVIMLMMTFTLMNICKLTKERMLMQNAADNAALSMAIMRGRALNRMGYLVNDLTGVPATDAPIIAEIATISPWYSAASEAVARDVAKFQDRDIFDQPKGAEDINVIQNPAIQLTQVGGGWLEQTGGFDNQKVVVEAYKTAGHSSNAGYPIGMGFLNITWPEIRARAAAAVYNVKGPMFPLAGAASLDAAQDYYFNATAVQRAAAVPPFHTAAHTHKWLPADAPAGPPFLDAHDGGWEAHLVPIGGAYGH